MDFMIHLPWRDPPLTDEQAADLFWLFLEDDAEDAPWMVMGDLQFWSASSFAHSLRIYAHEQRLPWYVASMLPIKVVRQKSRGKQTLAPDVFVSRVPEHPRTSYDLQVEGHFPEFVLEVVSPSSAARDEDVKVDAYEALEAKEYVLFTPKARRPSVLRGYRLNEKKRFEPLPLDSDGRLWSTILGLNLVVRGTMLQAQTADGRLLLTPEQDAEARRRAEAEVERLRREIERYRDSQK
jgi:Uma2 family endonuclease